MPSMPPSTSTRTASHRCAALPFFLETPRGPLFCLYRRPADAAALRGNVLFIPAFNEEMNRCRSMLTLQAESLAAHGMGSLVIDLHGTGDSAGEYVDARWSHWLADIRIASDWLESQPGGCIAHLGIRLGAMLAAAAAPTAPQRTQRLVLWQAVVDGKQHFTQFLRVKMAAQMDRPDLPKETTGTMRAQLAAGTAVEIGGYEIHPELAQALDDAKLARWLPRPGTQVLWLEQPPPGATELAPPSLAAQQAWRDGGVECSWQSFEGPSFWQQHERVLAPAAIEATTAWLLATEKKSS
jgi:exosortase A-associated hydrolase 2